MVPGGWGWLVAAAMAVAGPPAGSVRVGPGPGDAGDPRDRVGVDEAPGAPLPLDAPFVDETGRHVRLGGAFSHGRPVLLVPVWLRCRMLCGVVLDGVHRSLEATPGWAPGRDVEVVAVGIDPREGPDDARWRLARVFGGDGEAPPGWHVLTGGADGVAAVTDAIGFRYAWDPDTEQFAHAALAVAVSPDGRVARYLYGVEPDPGALAAALAAARDRKPAASLEQVLLRCFRYTPALRRHAALIAGVLRGGAVLVLLGLAGLFAWMARRGVAGEAGA